MFGHCGREIAVEIVGGGGSELWEAEVVNIISKEGEGRLTAVEIPSSGTQFFRQD